MPTRADVAASTPKCPCFRTEGEDALTCATPMEWRQDRGVWVCPRHPHMETAPDDLGDARMASASDRRRESMMP